LAKANSNQNTTNSLWKVSHEINFPSITFKTDLQRKTDIYDITTFCHQYANSRADSSNTGLKMQWAYSGRIDEVSKKGKK